MTDDPAMDVRGISEEEAMAMREVLAADGPTEAQRLLTAYRLGRRDGERRWRPQHDPDQRRPPDVLAAPPLVARGIGADGLPVEVPIRKLTDALGQHPALHPAEVRALRDARDEPHGDGRAVLLADDTDIDVINDLLVRELVACVFGQDPMRYRLTLSGLALHYRLRQIRG